MDKNIILIIDDVHLEGRPPEMHLEFAKTLKDKIADVKSKSLNPILVCAGDIAEGLNGLKWISQFDCDIVYICGNHEFWGGDYFEVIDNLKNEVTKKEFSHVRFLHNQSIVINGVKFIGSTMWTDLGESWRWFPKNQIIKNFLSMADFRRITAKSFYENEKDVVAMTNLLEKNNVSRKQIDSLIQEKRYNPLLQLRENEKSVNFIEAELKKPFEGRKIVVSHHLPVPDLWMDKFKMDVNILKSKNLNDENLYNQYVKGEVKGSEDVLMMGFYVNSAYQFFEANHSPDIWIHGHFHQDVNGYIGKTRLISSPVGYMKQSSTLHFKEVNTSRINNDAIRFLKSQIESHDWNIPLNDNLRTLESVINQMNAAISIGVFSIADVKKLIQSYLIQHKVNLENLEKQLLTWFNILLSVTRPNFYSLPNHDDFFILTKIMNLEKVVFDGTLKFVIPEDLNIQVNEFSFLDEKKFQSLNKAGNNIHYKEWLKNVNKIQIQTSQLRRFLINMLEMQENK